MTKLEADVIGGLNMTDQISNEAYKKIMIAAQDENEVGEVLDKIKAEISEQSKMHMDGNLYIKTSVCMQIIDEY